MTPQVGEVWLFHAVGKSMLFLLLRDNKHGSFDMLDLETGIEHALFRNWKIGFDYAEWERFA